MNSDIQFDPVPYDEAAKIVADRPVVDQTIFRQMIPEIRARSFLISGIEDLHVAQEIRDIIAELPRGGDWDSLKNQIEKKLLGPGGIPWLDEEGASKRATILMRHHGFQAYAAAKFKEMDEQREAFPYWQYRSMGDDRVRDSHAKLHGLILPADHKFWLDHFPPWDWGCRCQVLPITVGEYDEVVRAGRVAGQMELTGRISEDFKLKTRGWTLPDMGVKYLETTSRLDEGIGSTVDVASPVKRAQIEGQTEALAAYQWNPGDLRIPVSELYERYGNDPVRKDAFGAFYRNMQAATYKDENGLDQSVWEWAIGADVERAAKLLLQRAQSVRRVEHALLLDHRTGAVLEWAEGSSLRKVDPNAMLKRAAESGRRVVLMHNHFGGGIPSPKDVETALQHRDVVVGNVVVGPNGERHLVRVNLSIPAQALDYEAALLHNFHMRYKMGLESLERWKTLFGSLHERGIIHYENPR